MIPVTFVFHVPGYGNAYEDLKVTAVPARGDSVYVRDGKRRVVESVTWDFLAAKDNGGVPDVEVRLA